MNKNNEEQKFFNKLLRMSYFANILVAFCLFLVCLLVSWLLTFAFKQVDVWVGTFALFGLWMTWNNIKASSLYVALIKFLEYKEEEGD